MRWAFEKDIEIFQNAYMENVGVTDTLVAVSLEDLRSGEALPLTLGAFTQWSLSRAQIKVEALQCSGNPCQDKMSLQNVLATLLF